MENTPNNRNTYNPGEEIFSWVAHDYHPHERGLWWYIISSIIILGISLWAFLSDPAWGWITSATILIFSASYFYVHKDGHKDHEIRCFERGLLIDGERYFTWDRFEGFWFIYDETASILNFEFNGNKNQRLILQMGEKLPDFFEENLKKIELPKLENKKEAMLDLWIRALKL